MSYFDDHEDDLVFGNERNPVKDFSHKDLMTADRRLRQCILDTEKRLTAQYQLYAERGEERMVQLLQSALLAIMFLYREVQKKPAQDVTSLLLELDALMKKDGLSWSEDLLHETQD